MRNILILAILVLCCLPNWASGQLFWSYEGEYVSFPTVNNSPLKPGYKLIFQDEFDGPVFDDVKWNRENYFIYSGTAGCTVDNLYHTYAGSNGLPNYQFWQGGGTSSLLMIARRQAPPRDMFTDQQPRNENLGAELRPYTTAAFDSREAFKYGFLEGRFRIPHGTPAEEVAIWPAFWLFFKGERYPNVGIGKEIDVFEIMTNCPRDWGTNIWGGPYDCPCSEIPNVDPMGAASAGKYNCANGKTFSLDPRTLIDFADDYWTFGLEWDTERVHFYLNNVLVRSITRSCRVSQVFSKIILNIGINEGRQNACYDYVPALPGFAHMEVDYVRFYKRILAREFAMQPLNGVWNTDRHKLMMADVNGDRRDDIIGFGESAVKVALAGENESGITYGWSKTVFEDLCYAQGWAHDRYEIVTCDVNGDRKADILGFGGQGVFLSRSTSTETSASFEYPKVVLRYFGSDQDAGGYEGRLFERIVGDVNGDGKDDIVGFQGDGAWVSLANAAGNGFTEPARWTAEFGSQGNPVFWDRVQHRRKLADINGDGLKDILGLHDDTAYVALSAGDRFLASQKSHTIYSVTNGWFDSNSRVYPADINGDKKADLIGVNFLGCFTSISEGDRFAPPIWQWDSIYNQRMDVSRFPMKVGDVTGDGRADIVIFGHDGVYVSESHGNTMGRPTIWYNEMGEHSLAGDFVVGKNPRMLADLDGDRILDIVGFGNEGLYGHESPNCPPNNPCSAGFNPEIYGGYIAEDTLRPRAAMAPSADELSIRSYPNPSEGFFHVEILQSPEAEVKIQVFDLQGKKLNALGITSDGSKAFTIDLREQAAGVYLVHVTSGSAKKVIKLLQR